MLIIVKFRKTRYNTIND